MEIVVDIGNTFTKVAVFKTGEIQLLEGLDEHADLSSFTNHDIKFGIISSVAGNPDRWIQLLPSVSWTMLTSKTRVPFINKYATPETLGLDRIALASAAIMNYPNQDVLVIDAGTCITFDFISAKGDYLGGAISPGINMRLQSMNLLTAKLPLVQLSKSVDLVGNSTKSCLQSGALIGAAAEIDGVINRYKERYKNLIIVLTGGDTKVLAPLVKNGIFARQNFLLEGLHAVLAHNKL